MNSGLTLPPFVSSLSRIAVSDFLVLGTVSGSETFESRSQSPLASGCTTHMVHLVQYDLVCLTLSGPSCLLSLF